MKNTLKNIFYVASVPPRSAGSIITVMLVVVLVFCFFSINNNYVIADTTEDSSDATLSSLVLSSGTLSPGFIPENTDYTADVANDVSSITVTPTVTESHATVTVNGNTLDAAYVTIDLIVGSNPITIVVTSQDTFATKTYTVTVTRAASSDATLSSLVLSSGTLSPAFSPGTASYTADVVNGISSITVTPTVNEGATVTVNGNTLDAAYVTIDLIVGSNPITIVVTSQDTFATKTYTVTVTRAASSDATLSSLVLSSGTLSPAFSPGTASYTADVVNGISSITVTPTVNEGATATVNGNTLDAAYVTIDLIVGSNPITIVITAQDTTTTGTYTVTVTRADALSGDATLSSLALSSGTLSPDFNPGTTGYTASMANGVSSITVTPAVNESHATVTVNGTPVVSGAASGAIGLDVGSNTISIVVTAQDITTTVTYTVTVTRAEAISGDATLSSLALSSGTLSPDFNPGTTGYTASVVNGVSSITVTPAVNESHATVTVNGTPVVSGAASGAIGLDVGSNTISIVVTAQDITTTVTYTVTVTRAEAISGDATLSSLALSSGTLSPDFNPGTTGYTASMANGVSSITVTPAVTESHATVTVNGTPVTSGTPSGSIGLDVGSNTINIVVTAQDITTTVTYTVTVTRAASVSSGSVGGGSQDLTIAMAVTGLTPSLDINLNLLGKTRELNEMTFSDGWGTIQIPAGTALLDRFGEPLTSFSVQKVATLPLSPDGKTVLSAYDFKPDGARFSPPIKITLKYNLTVWPPDIDPARLQVGYWNGSTWDIKEGTIDTKMGTISFTADHFSMYSITYPGIINPVTTTQVITVNTPVATTTSAPVLTSTPVPEPTLTPIVAPPVSTPVISRPVNITPTVNPAINDFAVKDLTISPIQAKIGEKVIVSVVLSNHGESVGTYQVALKVNNSIADTKVVSLNGGKSTTVTFDTSGNESGNYEVDVNGLRSSFNISGNTWLQPLIEMIVGIGVLIIIFIPTILSWRKRKTGHGENR